MRWDLVLACATGAICATAGGCGSRQVQEVNLAAAARVSYTDDMTHLMAERGAALLSQAGGDYTVGPEDLLEISVFEWEVRNETRSIEARVSKSGGIALPALGEMRVAGLSVEQVHAEIERRLREEEILRVPRVSVIVKEYHSKRVAVVGAVREPGVFTLRQNVTSLLEALTLAGGPNERAGQMLYVIRTRVEGAPAGEGADGPRIASVDLSELLESEAGLRLNITLQDGDVVNVPEAKRFYVIGFVKNPGGFALTRATTALDAIALAGGLREVEASPTACVLRRQTREGEVNVPLDLLAISRGREPNVVLQPNDIVDVRQTRHKRIALGVYDFFRNLVNFAFTYPVR